MEIVIGKTERVESKTRSSLPLNEARELAVRVLHVRPARSRLRRKNLWRGQNRRLRNNALEKSDPVNAKVLLLLAPDGQRLPPDLDKGKYELRLTIHPKKPKKVRKPEAEAVRENGFTRWA
jgi:hypothetical protein